MKTQDIRKEVRAGLRDHDTPGGARCQWMNHQVGRKPRRMGNGEGQAGRFWRHRGRGDAQSCADFDAIENTDKGNEQHYLYRSREMAVRHLIQKVERRYKAMPRKARIAEIRAIAGRSATDDKFVRRTFPSLYREAFAKR